MYVCLCLTVKQHMYDNKNKTPEIIPGAFICVEDDGTITGIPFGVEIDDQDNDSAIASPAV